MHRRDLFKLTATVPAFAAASASASAQTADKPATTWKPETLDAHQNETVIALSDLIIPDTDTPGAKVAGVNRYIDLFLRDGSVEARDRFVAGLGWLDGYAIQKHSNPFVRCSNVQQTAILTTLDEGRDASVAAGTAFSEMAKSMTSRIYYSTAIGFRELNKGGRVPRTFGCKV